MHLFSLRCRIANFWPILRPHSISGRVFIQNILLEFVAHSWKLLHELGETFVFFLCVIFTGLLNSI